MKYKLEPTVITTKKGAKIPGFKTVWIDTAKNLSYVAKRQAQAQTRDSVGS
jgi:hypothetical protein